MRAPEDQVKVRAIRSGQMPMLDDPEAVPPLRSLMTRILASEARIWRGHARLAGVFWLDGVLGSSALVVLYATALYLRAPVAEQALLLFCGVYTVWILVAIWRSSQGRSGFWPLLARYLTIAWAANVALVLVFRQLDLVLLFVGVAGHGGGAS